MWSYKDGAISSVQVSVNLIGASSWLFCPKLIIALVESYLHRLSNSRNFYTMTLSATTWKVSFVSAPLDVPACQTCWSKRSYGNGDLNSYINFNMNTSKKWSSLSQSATLIYFQEYWFAIPKSWKTIDEGRRDNCKVLCFASKRNKNLATT